MKVFPKIDASKINQILADFLKKIGERKRKTIQKRISRCSDSDRKLMNIKMTFLSIMTAEVFSFQSLFCLTVFTGKKFHVALSREVQLLHCDYLSSAI